MHVGIIGGGFTGLAAAYELAKANHKVTIFEADSEIGGLAGTFEIEPGIRLEKFYHHWFTSDTDVLNLISELGMKELLMPCESNTGMFYANSIFRLTRPLDLLRFPAIPLIDRIRTGLMALYARRITNWRDLEWMSAEDWLVRVGGRAAYETIWKPLIHGKFGPEATEVSAVWIWNKLKLRGSSRDSQGKEQLLYIKGGFAALTDGIHQELERLGVTIHLKHQVDTVIVHDNRARGVIANGKKFELDQVLVTTPIPIFSKLAPSLPRDYKDLLGRIRYLGNACLVLRLNRSLSSTYWLNVADPEFPFVGVIEHTNLDDRHNYGGEYIAYLSKYLPTSDRLFSLSPEEYFEYCIPYLKKIFPEFVPSWVNRYHLWKAEYSQPIITKGYSSLIPDMQTPIRNLWLSTMAQIYPEDRGTNYAVREGRKVGRLIASSLS